MKIALGTHALRGYPPRKGGTPRSELRHDLFRWVKRHGFDGIDVGDWWFDFYQAAPEEIRQLRREVQDAGLEISAVNCLRKCVTHPAVAEQNRRDLRRAVDATAGLGARVVSVSLSLAPSVSGTSEDRIKGLPVSPGGGRGAAEDEFRVAAAVMRELAEAGAVDGVEVALELHHCSLADTSQRLLRILEMADHPNLSANPDLGNLYGAYDVPEEPWYEAIEHLAGHVSVWHVKNVQRVYFSEVHRAVFVHAALGEGDIDYRWALARLMQSGFDGCITIEGSGPGDLLAFAGRGKAYLDALLGEHRSGLGLRVH